MNLRRISWAGVLATAFAASCPLAASGQTFQSQGPSPSSGPIATVQSGDQLPNGTVSGAVQAIAVDPTDSRTIFIGAPNGGIWVTRDGGASWKALSDKNTSLSISSLAFDPTDTTRQKLIAGIGATSNGHIAGRDGGQLTGILYSSNNGTSWTELAGSGSTLVDQNIVAVAARGTTLLAASNSGTGGGLYRSVNSGTDFALDANLRPGQVWSLAGDTANSNLFYASVVGTAAADSGIYKSDITGSTWTKVLSLGTDRVARLATGPSGAIVAAVYDSSSGGTTSGQLVAIQLSTNGGTSWVTLDDAAQLPKINPGRQASTNLAVALDPKDASVIYIAGDFNQAQANPTIAAFRVRYLGNGQWSTASLTDAGTADGSTVHADGRVFMFDASGRLLLGGDGGVFMRTNPGDATGKWTGLNSSTLALREIYGIAYDGISNRLTVASQDTGTATQTTPRSAGYTAIGPGDGFNAIVDDTSSTSQSISYFTAQSLGPLTRRITTAAGTVTSSQVIGGLNVPADDRSKPGEDGENELPFASKIVFNRKNPAKLAIATNYLYTTTDASLVAGSDPLTNLGRIVPAISDKSGPQGLAYGAADDEGALLVGASNTVGSTDTNWLSLARTGTALTRLANYNGGAAVAVLFDARTADRYFVADGSKLWTNVNSTTSTTFTDLTANLTGLNVIRPSALEFISKNGVNALVVGGLVSTAATASPLVVADSSGTGVLSNWRLFGNGLPNTFVGALSYSSTADVLAVGTFGRGAWLLYDTTTFFDTATVLRYGAANNDSSPDATFLTDGTAVAQRPLEKVGSGTLTIAGTSAYRGSTTVKAGTMVVDGSIASSSGATVDAGASLRGTGTVPATTVNGTLQPGSSGIGTLTVNNSLTFGAGGTYTVDVSSAAASRTNVVAGSGAGTATLAGTVNAVVTPGSFSPSRSYTILNAAGGRTGTFGSVTSSLPFVQAALTYDASNVLLTLTPGGFANGGQSGNQRAVGSVFDRSVASATGDFATVINALSQMSAGQAPGVFDQLSGQQHAGIGTLSVQVSQVFMSNFAQQTGGAQSLAARTGGAQTANGGGRIALAEPCDGPAVCTLPPLGERTWGAWGGALAGFGTIAGSAESSAQTYNIGGFAAGLDRRIEPGLLAGITLGTSNSTLYTQGLSGMASSNNVQAGLYGLLESGNAYLDLLASYARGTSQTLRQITVPGLATRTAIGQAGTNSFFGQLEGGYRIDLDRLGRSLAIPFARVQGSTVSQAAFTETGADSLNLSVAAQTTNSLRSVFGL